MLGKLEEVLVTLLVLGGEDDGRLCLVDIVLEVAVVPAVADLLGRILHDLQRGDLPLVADLGVEVDDHVHVLHVGRDIPELVERGRLDLPADFPGTVTVIAVLGLEKTVIVGVLGSFLASMISMRRGRPRVTLISATPA